MTPSDLVALVARLRARLTTIPKPGSKPFDPPPGWSYEVTLGGEHKPGDPAGYASINVNLTACSSALSVFKMQEMVYAKEPLSWGAAAALEQLQAELLEYQQCLDAGIEHRMRRKAETEAESLRAELEAVKAERDEGFLLATKAREQRNTLESALKMIAEDNWNCGRCCDQARAAIDAARAQAGGK